MSIKIDPALLDSLTEQAKASPRLRMNHDLRNSSADTSQRMLNAIEPGSDIPIHRHRNTSETVVVLRGRVVEEFYDELECRCDAAYEVSPSGPICALNIPAGTWHTLRSLESGTVILEVKDGAYEPIQECDILRVGLASEAPQAKTDAPASDLPTRLRDFIEDEARSGSMDPALITPEYIFRMWGGKVPLEDIREAMKRL